MQSLSAIAPPRILSAAPVPPKFRVKFTDTHWHQSRMAREAVDAYANFWAVTITLADEIPRRYVLPGSFALVQRQARQFFPTARSVRIQAAP